MSPMAKFYHNTTAKYNGYFNANEIMTLTFANLNQQHQDNYTRLLPLFPYLENDNPKGISPAMDTAIKKVSVVVNLHRESQWTDDCYLLVGKAQFLKKDYESAEATFKYILNEFKPDGTRVAKGRGSAKRPAAKTVAERRLANKETQQERKLTAKEKQREQKRIRKERERRIKQQKKERAKYNSAVKKARRKGTPLPKRPSSRRDAEQAPKPEEAKAEEQKKDDKKAKDDKKKKKDDKPKPEDIKPEEQTPDNYFLKHRPVYQDAKLWLAKTLIERQKYDAAQRLLNELIEDPKTFKDIKKQAAPVQAHLFLHQRKSEMAIQPLENAIATADQRNDKARYAFVLAQLYQQSNRSDLAYATFERVLRYTNAYKMEFNARLSMAQNAWGSGKGTAQDAIANLNKMLRDEKNAEYKDQLYFALGNIALKTGDRPGAIENLQLALENGGSNNAQKTETSILLANLFFEAEDFVPAKEYFDIALQVMPKTDPRYKETERLSKNLTDISRHLQTIALQDSLLRIASMSEDERKSFAANTIRQRAEAAAAQAAQQADNAPAPRAANTPALQKESSFFAYNDRNLRQGVRDFQRKWGDRPLEDNWRRSSRQSFTTTDDAPIASAEAAATAVISDEAVAAVLQGVPKTEAEMTIANIKLREAYFSLGKLYRDRLENNRKSVEAMEELNRRYPGSNEELDSWYYLYLAHTDLNNIATAQTYARKIMEKYENSTYAKVLKDPSYIVQVQNEENRLTQYYNEAYAAFTRGDYRYAYDQSLSAREKFGANNALQPKFALLSAMSVGNLQGKDQYVTALNEVVAKYPNTEEQKYAREVLRLLGASTGTLPGAQKIEADQFETQDDQVHSVIVVLSDATNLNDARNAVSDYNRKYHDLDRLRISDVFLPTGEIRIPIVVVRRFRNKEDAIKYVDGVQKNSKDFIPTKIKYEIYAITQTNYGKLFATVKSIDAYRAFYEANY